MNIVEKCKRYAMNKRFNKAASRKTKAQTEKSKAETRVQDAQDMIDSADHLINKRDEYGRIITTGDDQIAGWRKKQGEVYSKVKAKYKNTRGPKDIWKKVAAGVLIPVVGASSIYGGYSLISSIVGGKDDSDSKTKPRIDNDKVIEAVDNKQPTETTIAYSYQPEEKITDEEKIDKISDLVMKFILKNKSIDGLNAKNVTEFIEYLNYDELGLSNSNLDINELKKGFYTVLGLVNTSYSKGNIVNYSDVVMNENDASVVKLFEKYRKNIAESSDKVEEVDKFLKYLGDDFEFNNYNQNTVPVLSSFLSDIYTTNGDLPEDKRNLLNAYIQMFQTYIAGLQLSGPDKVAESHLRRILSNEYI